MDNENLKLAGIQLSNEGAQITWYDKSLEEPQTLALPDEGEDGLIRVPADAWKGALRGGRFGSQALTRFLTRIIEMIPGETEMQDLRICVTVPSLTRALGDHIVSCLEGMGIERKNIFLQDFRTSFFYYVITRRRELWMGDVAFLRLKGEEMVGSILHIDRTVKPASATFQEVASADVSAAARGDRNDADWDRERDRRLYELLGRLYERRNVTTSYLYGPYFDRSWAERSFQYLTFRRHAFQGQNLFSKGACCSVMARLNLITLPEILFRGVDMISHSVGMRLRVRGREQYRVLIPAGINWYEAHSSLEVIPDDETSITILTTPAEGGETVGRVLRLDHFPVREPRATRLRMTLFFTSPECLEMEVEDLGFGQITPPSGKIWKRKVLL